MELERVMNREDVQGGCSVMRLDDWMRCDGPIARRSTSYDMPLCAEHAARLKDEGFTCMVSADHFVGLAKQRVR